MNFTQWKRYAEKKDVSKITYICGSDSTLRELVIEDIKNILEVDSANYAQVTMNELWEQASKYPLDPDKNRLTVVRQAADDKSWKGLAEWISQGRNNNKNYIVFVTDEDDAPAIFAKGKRSGYVEHVEVIRAKGKFIRCSTPNSEDLVLWANSFGLSKVSAEYLIDRVSADTSSMYNVLRKVRIWNGSPNVQAIKALCDEEVLKTSFCDYLVLGDRVSAYRALEQMSYEEKMTAISKLDTILDYLLEINRCLARRMYDMDIASTTGIKIFLVKKFKPVAKNYNVEKVKRCRQVIALVDAALQSGISKGSMERLITLW